MLFSAHLSPNILLSLVSSYSQEKKSTEQQSFEMLRNPYLNKGCIYSTVKMHIWQEQKRAGNVSVEVPTHSLTKMLCSQCVFYGKCVKQFNITFTQGEKTNRKSDKCHPRMRPHLWDCNLRIAWFWTQPGKIRSSINFSRGKKWHTEVL